jgi:WD40 repeat protein
LPDDGRILICDLKTQKTIKTLVNQAYKQPCFATVFRSNAKLLATCGADPSVRVWDTEKGEQVADLRGHKYWLSCVAWSPDGKELATASWDGIRILDLKKKALRRTLKSVHAHAFGSCAYSPDGSKVVAGDKDGNIVVWDLCTGQEIGWLSPHESIVWQLAFSGDGEMLATVSDDHRLRVWKADSFFKNAAANMQRRK